MLSNIVRTLEGVETERDVRVTREQAGPTAGYLHYLGGRLRELRTTHGWSMQALADRSGVSRRMLTQIELGQANPSLVTVDKLARALGTDFASLSLSSDPAALVVSPPVSAGVLWSSPAGSQAVLHKSTRLRPVAELWEWALVPGDQYQAQPDPVGSQELYLVSAGTLTIELENQPPAILPAGTSAALLSDRSYMYRNTGDRPVRFVKVVQLAR